MRENVPSATAEIVAKNLLLVASTPGLAGLVPNEARRLGGWLVEDSSRRGHLFVRGLEKRWFQAFLRALERLTIPGLALHQALRKRYIEHTVRSGLSEGFEQVVVLGGGLDSLSVRLHAEFPQANFVELDHPATQSVKLRSLTDRHLIGRNLKLLPVDLSKQSLEESLVASGHYHARRNTVFLAEGLLMYLEAREVDAVFDFVRRKSGARKRLVFTFMEVDEKGRARFRRSTRLARLWLSLKREPFKWGMRPEEAEGFLTERGFILKELAASATLREIYLRERGPKAEVPAEGENVCVADAFD